jgi:hypothetical protein
MFSGAGREMDEIERAEDGDGWKWVEMETGVRPAGSGLVS